MNSSADTDILIVGAGPTGLMMACQLAMRNIPFRIIDKTEDHTTQSRALVIQARSLEILDQMGIADKALKQGKVARAIGAFFNGKKVLRVTVNDMGEGLTRFPFLLMLEQSHTEQILIDFLEAHGIKVERKTWQKKLSQNAEEVTATLQHADGSEESLKADYIVGADGAHSRVREELNIPFGGKTYEESLFVLDCKAEVDLPHDEMYLTFADSALGGFFPLTNGRWRILGNLPEELEGKEEITFEDVEKDFAKRVHMDVKLYDPQWISAYRSHHRYASTFRAGRCFLAGDAAHIHSPVGAQGMNTGLQDAYNLAWKLAAVIKWQAKDSLLDTYTGERLSVARTLVNTTDKMFNIITSQNFFLRSFRKYVVPFMLRLGGPLFQKLKFIQRFAFKRISEIGISYRDSTLSGEASQGSFPAHAPKPGDRLPYICYTDESGKETNIQEKTRNSFFCLFVFSTELSEELLRFKERFGELISVVQIPDTENTAGLRKALGVDNGGCYLVRPDMYIGYRSSALDVKHLTNYLSRFLEI